MGRNRPRRPSAHQLGEALPPNRHAVLRRGTAGFPVDFTIQTRSQEGISYSTVRTVTGQPSPNGQPQTYSLSSAYGRYLRLHVTRLGAPAADESGRYRLQLAEIVIE